MKVALIYLLGLVALITQAALAQEKQFTDLEKQLPVYKLLIKLHQAGLEEGMTNVPPQDGRFLQMLVKMSRAKNVLEIGTSSGVSTIWMALGLKETGGKITTLEIDHLRANIARENFRQAGLEDRIQLIEGDALKTMGTLTGTYDMVFIDAAKEQYKQYLELIYSRIPKGGVIVAHNAVRMAHQIRDYLDFVQNNSGLDTVILTTGNDGVALSYKK